MDPKRNFEAKKEALQETRERFEQLQEKYGKKDSFESLFSCIESLLSEMASLEAVLQEKDKIQESKLLDDAFREGGKLLEEIKSSIDNALNSISNIWFIYSSGKYRPAANDKNNSFDSIKGKLQPTRRSVARIISAIKRIDN